MPVDIPPGTALFIDANIFLYKILDHRKYAEPCSNLLKEIRRGRYSGVISVLVCSEVFHRVMLAEVTERHDLDPRHVARYLKDNPEEIKELTAARSAIETIKQIENLKVVGLEEDSTGLFLEYSRTYGLLSNDALHLATMKQEGILTLASNDRDFERVEWVKQWRP
jgi:uncharacterized protein